MILNYFPNSRTKNSQICIEHHLKIIKQYSVLKEYYPLHIRLTIKRNIVASKTPTLPIQKRSFFSKIFQPVGHVRINRRKLFLHRKKRGNKLNSTSINTTGLYICLIAKINYIYVIKNNLMYFPGFTTYYEDGAGDKLRFSSFVSRYYYKKSLNKFIFSSHVFFVPNYHIKISRFDLIIFRINEFFIESYNLFFKYKYQIIFLLMWSLIFNHTFAHFLLPSIVIILTHHKMSTIE